MSGACALGGIGALIRWQAWSKSIGWRERIIIDDKILLGKPIVKGTRIAVEFVIDLLGSGWTVDQVLTEYDHLTPQNIQACPAYASNVL